MKLNVFNTWSLLSDFFLFAEGTGEDFSLVTSCVLLFLLEGRTAQATAGIEGRWYKGLNIDELSFEREPANKPRLRLAENGALGLAGAEAKAGKAWSATLPDFSHRISDKDFILIASTFC